MTEQEKNIIAKLQIIKEMAGEKSVQQIADVLIEYVKTVSKGKLGFKE
jgi:hypothetical protein